MVREAVTNLRKAQGQLDSLALVGLGLSITLLLAILDKNPSAIGSVLLIPTLFFAIAFTQLRHERQLTLNAEYADGVLRPRIQSLLSQIPPSEVSLFGYEAFLAKRSWLPRLSLEWIGVISRAGVSLAVGMGLIVIFFYFRLALSGTRFEAYEYWLLFVNLLMLAGDSLIALFVARIRYEYYSKQYYHTSTHTEEKHKS
jgi:uncharacterized RDD family membrane protein YckC